MKSRANSLLIELLIVIVFFMFTAVILVELFGAAKGKSLEARAISNAALDSQNIAEMLYTATEPETELFAQGFTRAEDGWTLMKDDYSLWVTEKYEETEAGELRTYEVTAIREEQPLISIPSVRYWPKEGTPRKNRK